MSDAHDRLVDVVVVGMGAAALAAAIEAHDHGATVAMLEKAPERCAGGQTRVSGATWFDNRDPVRAATYLRSLCGDHEIPDAIVEVWARETARNTEWVESLGAVVARMDTPPGYPELPGHECFGGLMHVAPTWGMGRLFEVLSDAARQRGITQHYETRAVGLRQDADGRVVGVDAIHEGAEQAFLASRAVVLATGGFQANAEMLREYTGLVGAQQWGSPFNTGDGHRMAMDAGADLWHMHNHYPVPGLRMEGFASGILTMPPSDGYLFVGPDGTRFADETAEIKHGHVLRHGRYELFPRDPMWIVFDERTRCSGPFTIPFDEGPFGWSLLVDGYRWSADNRAEIDRGWIISAPSVESLADRLEMSPSTLTATIERYNAACRTGADEQFGRDPSKLVAVDHPPYYAFKWGPVLNFTMGGPRRNERSQVLDAAGDVIAGLYCAGEMTMSYSRCFDSGMPIADALAFGRVAGRAAASEQPRRGVPE